MKHFMDIFTFQGLLSLKKKNCVPFLQENFNLISIVNGVKFEVNKLQSNNCISTLQKSTIMAKQDNNHPISIMQYTPFFMFQGSMSTIIIIIIILMTGQILCTLTQQLIRIPKRNFIFSTCPARLRANQILFEIGSQKLEVYLLLLFSKSQH